MQSTIIKLVMQMMLWRPLARLAPIQLRFDFHINLAHTTWRLIHCLMRFENFLHVRSRIVRVEFSRPVRGPRQKAM